MKLILCVDDKGGLAFNHRRQSRDRVLNEHILMHCGMHRLWISPYTGKAVRSGYGSTALHR